MEINVTHLNENDPCKGVEARTRNDIVAMVLYHDNIMGTGKDLKIMMPCGKTVIYADTDMIPNKSEKCPCGNPEHWIIKYNRRMKQL